MSKVLGKYVIIDRADVGKTTEDLLRDLLFESTGARIPADKIQYGKPRELKQRPQYKYDPNTFIPVVVDIVYDTRFRSAGDGFMYRRRSIIEHCANVDFSSISPDFFPFRISDIIDKINEQLEYPITMDNLVEFEYSSVEQWADGVMLQARDDSYLWTDGQKVLIDTSKVNHQNLLTNHTLDGFNIYQPPGGPYLIGGFIEHRGPCGNIDCPICSDTGKVVESTAKHIADYVEMTARPISGAFRTTPVDENSISVAPGNTLAITPPPDVQELIIAPPDQVDVRPSPIVDYVVSPYDGTTQTSDCQDVNLAYYAPPKEPQPIASDSPYHPDNMRESNGGCVYINETADNNLTYNNCSGGVATPPPPVTTTNCNDTTPYINDSVINGYLGTGCGSAPVYKPVVTSDCGCL